ncbi:MAG: helix-turn-helix domain-containing protein [Planctomycetota bacterium]
MSTTPNTSTTNAQQQPLTIGALVRTRRLELNLTLDRVGERAGCSKSYLSAIENDRGAHPGPALIARLEEALALEPGSLRSVADLSVTPAGVRARLAKAEAESRAARRLVELVGTGQSQGGTADRSPLDEAYRSGEVGQLLQRLGASAGDQPEAVPLPLEVPLINKVAAGYPTEFTDLGYPARIADEYVRCPDLADPDAFAARVVGTSMQPDYREGDIVIFSPAR